MNSFLRKLLLLTQRPDKEAELREELQFHLEEEAKQRQEDGLEEREARWAAHRELGNLALVEENTRAVWGWTLLEQLRQDVRYAFRTIAANRLFTLLAVSSLALGIGANTAIFSLINAVVLKALPVSHPEQLVELGMRTENGLSFTNPIWEQVRDRQDVFSGAFAYSPIRLNLAVGGEVRNANTSWVSGDFFRTLGVNPLLGRTITVADDTRGCSVIGVIS